MKKHSVSKIVGLAVAATLISSVIAALGLTSTMPSPVPAKVDMHDSNLIVLHQHVHLAVKVNGREIVVPANIGIDSALYKDHSLDIYAAINPPVAPVHTHDFDGIIHIESNTVREFTLGEFLDIWGVDFGSHKSVKMTLNGMLVDTIAYDYRKYLLQDGVSILLEFY